MCGITGFWSKQRNRITQETFDLFTDSLSHRGPDGRGVYNNRDANIWIGHRRLKILDLSEKGKQPFSDLSKRFWITYNGEIYNFLEIKHSLELLGEKFESDCDTEVILKSYIIWGEACQLKFNGMWAFAIWDTEKKELFLSRDRFGVKPLYYHFSENCFAFASEMKAFIALPNISLDYNSTVVDYSIKNLQSILPDKNQTWLKDIRQIGAGHSLLFSVTDEKILIKKWWETLDHLPELPLTALGKINGFRELFFDACKLRLRSDVRMGFALSGGLDSSSVLFSCHHLDLKKDLPLRCSSNWRNALTALYPNTTQDEELHANQVVMNTKVKATYVEVNPLKFTAEEIEKISFDFEDIWDLPFGPWLLYKKYRENGIYVSIDGHGADELLGGYHHQVKALINSYGTKHPYRFWDIRRTYIGLFKEKPSSQIYNMPSYRSFFKEYKDPYPHIDLDDPVNKQLYSDFHSNSLPFILKNFDRLSMAHGVEIRAPFMDWRVVCYAFALSGQWKIGGGYTKRILRKAMKGILPEVIRKRRGKIGFANPTSEWIAKGLYTYCLDRINSKTFLESPFWNGFQIKNEADTIYKEKRFGELRNYWECILTDILICNFETRRKKYVDANFVNT